MERLKPVISLRQELAGALEHASDERDTLLTEAAAASELRRRLAQAAAERDALSEQNTQLQREAQQLSAAGKPGLTRYIMTAGSAAQHQWSERKRQAGG